MSESGEPAVIEFSEPAVIKSSEPAVIELVQEFRSYPQCFQDLNKLQLRVIHFIVPVTVLLAWLEMVQA